MLNLQIMQHIPQLEVNRSFSKFVYHSNFHFNLLGRRNVDLICDKDMEDLLESIPEEEANIHFRCCGNGKRNQIFSKNAYELDRSGVKLGTFLDFGLFVTKD